jgi:hypothetical protein
MHAHLNSTAAPIRPIPPRQLPGPETPSGDRGPETTCLSPRVPVPGPDSSPAAALHRRHAGWTSARWTPAVRRTPAVRLPGPETSSGGWRPEITCLRSRVPVSSPDSSPAVGWATAVRGTSAVCMSGAGTPSGDWRPEITCLGSRVPVSSPDSSPAVGWTTAVRGTSAVRLSGAGTVSGGWRLEITCLGSRGLVSGPQSARGGEEGC